MRRTHNASIRRVLVGAMAACAAIALAACASASPAQTTSGATTAPPTSTGSAAPSAGDPHALRGPSTAATVAEITPVATHPKPKLPVTVTDESGTSVTITDASRILALDLYGTLAETVTALGLGDRLVGRGASSTLSSMKDLPVVTQDGHDLNGEAILALAPTLVLTDTTNGPREVQDQLRASGVTVVFFSPKRTLGTVGDQINAVAHALGVDAVGTKLVKHFDAQMKDVKAQIAALAPAEEAERLKMAFLYVRGQAGVFFIFGKGEGADDLIDGIDGIDVATQAGIIGVKPASSEALLATNPDVILVMTDGLASTGGIDGLLARPGVADTTAGRNKRIVDMADGQVLSFGPNAPAVLLSLARAVYKGNGA